MIKVQSPTRLQCGGDKLKWSFCCFTSINRARAPWNWPCVHALCVLREYFMMVEPRTNKRKKKENCCRRALVAASASDECEANNVPNVLKSPWLKCFSCTRRSLWRLWWVFSSKYAAVSLNRIRLYNMFAFVAVNEIEKFNFLKWNLGSCMCVCVGGILCAICPLRCPQRSTLQWNKFMEKRRKLLFISHLIKYLECTESIVICKSKAEISNTGAIPRSQSVSVMRVHFLPRSVEQTAEGSK